MGAYLSKPKTEKVRSQPETCSLPVHVFAMLNAFCMQDAAEGENADFQWGVCAMQGWRMDMVRCAPCRGCRADPIEFCGAAVSRSASADVPARLPSAQCCLPKTSSWHGTELSCTPVTRPNLHDNSFRASSAVANLLVQEDAHAIELDLQSDGKPKASMFGVFDGHGGKEVARFTAMHIVSSVHGPVHRHTAAARQLMWQPPCHLFPARSSEQARGLVMQAISTEASLEAM